MKWKDGDTTSPTLLRRVGDWRDDDAWVEFLGRYEPLIRLWFRRFGLSADESEELCQQIWVDVASRMQAYAYDPSRTFRGWLRRVSETRAIDLLRARRPQHADCFHELPGEAGTLTDPDLDQTDEEAPDSKRLEMLRMARQVHDLVKGRVEPRTWQAFWHVAVDDWAVRETAESLGMSYAAVFAAHKRVLHMLQSEGRRFLND